MSPRQWLMLIAHHAHAAVRSLYPGPRLSSLDQLYHVVNQWLLELDVEYWVAWGTLLGYHREGGLLIHDRDVDFSLLEAAYPRLVAAADRLPEGFTLHDTSEKHGGPKLYVRHRQWKADLYFYEQVEAELHIHLKLCHASKCKPVPVEQILPTRTASFLGTATRVPAQVEEHLRHCYGYIGRYATRDRRTGYFVPAGQLRS